MKNSTFYSLKQPEDNDNVLIDDLNGNFDVIDQTLHELDEEKAAKAKPKSAGNLAALTADGALQDSGRAPGKPNGVATLDGNGKIPVSQVPNKYLPLAGGTMSGPINMGNQRITNLPKPAADTEPLRRLDGLSSITAALFGLGADSVPDDALAYLGKYAQHWWRRRLLNAGTEYITPVVAGNSSFNDDPVTYILCTYRSYDPDYVYYNLEYSDGITYGNDGKPTGLAAPIKTVRLSNSNHATAAQVLKGKFIIHRLEAPDHSSLTADKGIAFIPENATFDSVVNYKTTSYVYSDYISIDITAMPKKGEWEYLQSNDDDAYPHSGESGGYEYESLGVPFENAATSPKIAIGYYVGTGTSGEENKNSLTFNFSPSLLVIRANDPSLDYGGIFVKGQEDGIPDARRSGVTSTGHIYIEWNGNTVNWYSPDRISNIQLNELNYFYYYTAIG